MLQTNENNNNQEFLNNMVNSYGNAKYRIFVHNYQKPLEILFQTDNEEVFLEEWEKQYRLSLHVIDNEISYDFEDDHDIRHGGYGTTNQLIDYMKKFKTNL